MEPLLDTIRAALADGATAEQRRAATDACEALRAQLGTGTTQAVPDVGAMLDNLIARLTLVAAAKEARAKAPPEAAPIAIAPEPARRFEIPFVPVTVPRK